MNEGERYHNPNKLSIYLNILWHCETCNIFRPLRAKHCAICDIHIFEKYENLCYFSKCQYFRTPTSSSNNPNKFGVRLVPSHLFFESDSLTLFKLIQYGFAWRRLTTIALGLAAALVSVPTNNNSILVYLPKLRRKIWSTSAPRMKIKSTFFSMISVISSSFCISYGGLFCTAFTLRTWSVIDRTTKYFCWNQSLKLVMRACSCGMLSSDLLLCSVKRRYVMNQRTCSRNRPEIGIDQSISSGIPRYRSELGK